jgi:hypothetical protein
MRDMALAFIPLRLACAIACAMMLADLQELQLVGIFG